MNVSDMLAGTAEACYATDQGGCIVAWNPAAERLLGLAACEVLGRRCWQVVDGTDVFGNRFCSERCPVRTMAARREAVSHFELAVGRDEAPHQRFDVCVFVIPGDAPSELTVVHHLQPVTPAPAPAPAGGRLTPRELEVLRLLADGRGTPELAAALGISRVTVRNHLQRIFSKLEVHSRIEAVAAAHRARLL